MFGLSTLKLIGIGVGALAVIALLAMVNGWRVERNHLRDWQTQVVAATRDASANPKLGKDHVAEQIKELGSSLKAVTAALNDQNARVEALGKASAQQQAEAARAVLNAQGRAKGAEATSQRLTASSRAGGAVAKPCEPSKALKEAWQ